MQQAARVSHRTAFFTAEVDAQASAHGRLVEFDDTRKHLHQPERQAHRGLHHRPLRLSQAPAAAPGGGTAAVRLREWGRIPGASRPDLPDRLKVLVVDCEEQARDLIDVINGQALEIQTTPDPAFALFLVGRTWPDIVLLAPIDGRLTSAVALEVLREREPQLPVVVGVGPGDGEFAARAAALEPSAVIAYPFRPEALVKLLRLLAPAHVSFADRPLPIDLGRLRIEGGAPDIWLDGVRTTLPLREFQLLRYLAERAGTVVSRAEIGDAVWGSAATGATNTVSVHIMRLRRRLADRDRGPQWITAVRGLGYRFNVPTSD